MRSRSCYRREKPREGEEGGERGRRGSARCAMQRGEHRLTIPGDNRRERSGGRGGGGQRRKGRRTDRVAVWVNHTPPLVHKYALIALFSPRADTRVRLSLPPSSCVCLLLPLRFFLCYDEIKSEGTREIDELGREDGQPEKTRGRKGRRNCQGPVQGSTGVNANLTKTHTRTICGTRTAGEKGEAGSKDEGHSTQYYSYPSDRCDTCLMVLNR